MHLFFTVLHIDGVKMGHFLQWVLSNELGINNDKNVYVLTTNQYNNNDRSDETPYEIGRIPNPATRRVHNL